MNKKIALIPIFIFVSFFVYFLLITSYGFQVNQEIQQNMKEFDEVKEFSKAYGSMTVSTKGIGFWFEEIIYSNVNYEKKLLVELIMYPQMDNRFVLKCIDITDSYDIQTSNERTIWKVIENPTVEDIRKFKNFCS